MTMRWTIPSMLVASFLAAACEKRAAVPEVPAAAETVASVDAGGDAAGICTEHGVLEAVCTKCNPALIPVFQAKGDWCAEHGLPESFCPICHPERGGRPATDVSPDSAPAEGTKIRFKTLETARRAGIETVAAVERPNRFGISAVGRIAYDATRVAAVNARAAGVVRAIHVDVGTKVRRGAPLAQIESAAVGADQSKLAAAQARMEVAAANYQRAKELHAKGIVPSKEVMAAEQELKAIEAEHTAALQALRVVGTGAEDGSYTLTAPLGGTVTQRNTSIGTLVDVEETLFEIVDPSAMWAEIDVREADLSALQLGQAVVLTVDGLGEREFTGRIDYIAPAVEPKTRTVMARARLANPDGALRANMYARVRIATGDVRHSLMVPRTAVQQAKGVSLAFVRLAEDLYETRRVEVRPGSGDFVELATGVRPGELVVTQGSFLLKTETLKGSIGAGCCEIEKK
jgi:cobalt-zinc-cadmium efflux system membrane fusion protein